MKAADYITKFNEILTEAKAKENQEKDPCHESIIKIAVEFLNKERPTVKYPDGKYKSEDQIRSGYRAMITKWNSFVNLLSKDETVSNLYSFDVIKGMIARPDLHNGVDIAEWVSRPSAKSTVSLYKL